jgi:hypothetical protein
MKEALAQKITSKEQFDTAMAAVYTGNRTRLGRAPVKDDSGRITETARNYNHANTFYNHDGYRRNDVTNLSDSQAGLWATSMRCPVHGVTNADYSRWWIVREHLRILWDVYDLPSSLHQVTVHFPELAVHCKFDEEDPAAVFYTPDPQAGERDSQVRISLGRLMRKLYPQISDDTIRDLEASHRAERSNEIELLTGADLVEAYIKGPSSCMAKPRSHWGDTLDGRHPAEVYDAPGFAMAVTRDGSGKVNGRSLVWVNPADENDKRYVRIYGDSSLKRRLERKGYRLAGLEGTRLKRIELSRQPDRTRYVSVLMPYLDYPGGNSGEKAARTVVLDGEFIRVVTHEGALSRALRARGIAAPSAGGTDGAVNIPLQACADAMYETCALTGERFDASNGVVEVLVDGEVKFVKPGLDSQVEAAFPLREVYTLVRGNVRILRAKADQLVFDNGRKWVDNDENRTYCGFAKLAEGLYGPNQWVKADQAYVADGGFVRKEDAVVIISPNSVEHDAPIVGHEHMRVVDQAEKGTWVKVHKHGSLPTFAHKDVPVEKTPSGRLVVPRVHDVKQRFDGVYDFDRNLRMMDAFGITYYLSIGQANPTEDELIAKFKDEIVEEFVDAARRDGAFIRGNRARDEALTNEMHYVLGQRACDKFGGVPEPTRDGTRFVLRYWSSWRAGSGTRTGWSDYIEAFLPWAERVVAAGTIPVGDCPYPKATVTLLLAALKAGKEAWDAKVAEVRATPAPAANTVRFTIAA